MPVIGRFVLSFMFIFIPFGCDMLYHHLFGVFVNEKTFSLLFKSFYAGFITAFWCNLLLKKKKKKNFYVFCIFISGRGKIDINLSYFA